MKKKSKNTVYRFWRKALGIRTVTETPQKFLDAVNNLSVYSRHFAILTWLPDLLKKMKSRNSTKKI